MLVTSKDARRSVMPTTISVELRPKLLPQTELPSDIHFTTQSLPSRGDAELPSKRNAVRGRTTPSRLQRQTRHLPAATVAEYAGHASALSATSGRAAGERRAPEIFGNEAKPRD
ncbi:hypothetical protein Bbelb_381850 [Branchiostoma belcheri]|nr:hypothetical protein Bbelb_381850 [Branchiostoma belcheri]